MIQLPCSSTVYRNSGNCLTKRQAGQQGLSQDLETGCPNGGFIDFWVSKVCYQVNTANEINLTYLQILLFFRPVTALWTRGASA